MSDTVSSGTFASPSSEDRNLGFLIYGLLFLSPFLWAFTGVIGVVIAYVRRAEADALMRTHFQFQIRTFWIGVAIMALSLVCLLIGLGFLFNGLFAAATHEGAGWDAWEAAGIGADEVVLRSETFMAFLAAVVLAVIGALWQFAASLFGLARLAGKQPIGRA